MAKYPEITAGQKITAELLRSMLPEVIVKPATTARSTATFAIDPDLQFEGVAGAQYLIEFNLMAAALAAADFKTEWQVPNDAAGLKAVLGPGTAAADGNANNIAVRAGVHQFGTDIVYNGVRDSNVNAFLVQEFGVITLVSGGTIGLNWAQGTSNATPTNLYGGSFMRVTRLA